MIVMTMRNGDGIHLLVANDTVKRKAVATFAFGMRAGVHEQAMPVDFQDPSAGTDVGVRIEISYPHELKSDNDDGDTSDVKPASRECRARQCALLTFSSCPPPPLFFAQHPANPASC